MKTRPQWSRWISAPVAPFFWFDVERISRCGHAFVSLDADRASGGQVLAAAALLASGALMLFAAYLKIFLGRREGEGQNLAAGLEANPGTQLGSATGAGLLGGTARAT